MKNLLAYLARHTFGRILLIPFILLAGAWSWATYLDGTKNAQDAGRVRAWWGWLAPAMEPHWKRLADPTEADYGNWFHSLKNVGAEWSRNDCQRSYKALSFTIYTLIVVAIGEWAVMAILR